MEGVKAFILSIKRHHRAYTYTESPPKIKIKVGVRVRFNNFQEKYLLQT